jgi:hypothetical protein
MATADERLEPLIAILTAFGVSVRDLESSVLRAAARGDSAALLRRLRRMEVLVDAQLERLADEIADWIEDEMPLVYEAAGAAALVAALSSLPWEWTPRRVAAFEERAADVWDSAAVALRYAAEDFGRFSTDVRRVASVIESKKYRSRDEAIRRVVSQMKSRGMATVTYSNGARYPVAAHLSTLMNTHTTLAMADARLQEWNRLNVRYVELLDGPTCGLFTHRGLPLASGQVVPIELYQSVPIAHPNAFLGGQSFLPLGPLRQVVRGQYAGPAVRVVTSEGHRFAVTPEHPVLTSRGWVLAGDLTPGDYVLRDARGAEGSRAGLHFSEKADAEDGFASIVEVGSHSRVVPAADDLHGAAEFCDPEIDVVDVDPSLVLHAQPLGLKGTRNGRFAFGRLTGALAKLGASHLRQKGVGRPTTSAVRVGGLGLASLGRPAAVVDCHWESIRSVVWSRYDGSVYDASTVDESYLVNGIVVANCVRSAIPRMDLTEGPDGFPVDVDQGASSAEQLLAETTAALRVASSRAAVEARR